MQKQTEMKRITLYIPSRVKNGISTQRQGQGVIFKSIWPKGVYSSQSRVEPLRCTEVALLLLKLYFQQTDIVLI